MDFLEHYGLNEQERRQRKAFLNLTENDARQVRDLRPVFEQHAAEFAERFYSHLLTHPQTAAFLRDPQQLERLKTLQVKYFSELLAGAFDEGYFEARLRVGRAHQRVRLEPAWYLGAYNQYIQITFPMFAEALGDKFSTVLPLLLSLTKVIFLDIGLALDTYFKDATDQLQRRNQELQQALHLYWQSQRREKQLRSMASHEIRGGLAAVITTLDDVQDEAKGKLAPSVQEQLTNLTRRCWAMTNLLKEMLSSTQPGGPTWVDTAQVFEMLSTRFGLYAEGRAIRLNLPDHAPQVWADPLQLREVFANLVANAVHYLDKEPGHVDISCRPEGEFYVFCVADNGPGIPANVLDHIFEPFVRGPAGQQRPEGTGLGLYFVRTVIEQGGGKVWVESTPGKGSRFSFTVPRVPLHKS